MYKTSFLRPIQFPTTKSISYHLQKKGLSNLCSARITYNQPSTLRLISISTSPKTPNVYSSIRMSSTGQNTRPIIVVAGVGNGSGTGAATAREFAKVGYSVALVARNADHLKKTAEEIVAAGGDAAAFPVKSYDYSVFEPLFKDITKHFDGAPIRVAVWNAGSGVFKKFLDVTEEDIRTSLDTNATAAFGFSRAAILTFKELPIDPVNGKRGALIHTGATAAIRGNVFTSAFAAGKFALRALSQSLAKEFGKENIHVSHAIIDGGILTKQSRRLTDPNFADFETNEDIRLSPESIAKAYLYLVNQDRSAWSWEIDLRPAHEKW